MSNMKKNILGAVIFAGLLLGGITAYTRGYLDFGSSSVSTSDGKPADDSSPWAHPLGEINGQKVYSKEDGDKQVEALRARKPMLLEICFGDLCEFERGEIEKVTKALGDKVDVHIIDVHANEQILPQLLYKSDGQLPRHVLVYKNQEYTLTGLKFAPEILAFVNGTINSKIFTLAGENRRDMLQYLPKNLPLLFVIEPPEMWQQDKPKMEAIARLFDGKIAVVYLNPLESKEIAKEIYRFQRMSYPGYKLFGLDNKAARLIVGDVQVLELAQFINGRLTKWEQNGTVNHDQPVTPLGSSEKK